jgi:peptide-methionine (S)-S-oxide reductase
MKRLILAAALALATVTSAIAQRIPTETAIFAGGCYWCTEADFDKIAGVIATTPGFMGGTSQNPTYENVTYGRDASGHIEAVRIEYDPTKITYAQLVEIFWRTIDPLDGGGQFCDRGDSYKTAIFPANDAERAIVEASKKKLSESGRFKQPIVTSVIPATTFWPSNRQADHDYYKKNPGHYAAYRAGCGRDARLKGLWGAEAGGKVATQ